MELTSVVAANPALVVKSVRMVREERKDRVGCIAGKAERLSKE
jgi:hypothetical protein